MNQNRSSRAVTALALTTLASSPSGLLLDISIEGMLLVRVSCYLHNFSLYTLIHYKESSLYLQRYGKYLYATNFSRNILLVFLLYPNNLPATIPPVNHLSYSRNKTVTNPHGLPRLREISRLPTAVPLLFN